MDLSMATALDLSGVGAQYPNKASFFNLLSPRHHNPHFPGSLPCKRQPVTLRVRCAAKVELPEKHDDTGDELTCVMKFGGSSVASADRMREVAELILSFPEETPVIVLSAMGKTTNNLLKAGAKAVTCGVKNVSALEELAFIKDLHLRTVDELGVEMPIISKHLFELEQLLNGIAMMKEMTPRTMDCLLSFGECMSTRIFAAYLNKIGVKARQYDAFEIGFTTTDDFTNADILEATYPAVAKRLRGDWISDPAIPVVTGFLGKGYKTGLVTTLGRGGSDLTATTIGKALGLREIQVWKDVDGVLTCDLNIHPRAEPVPYLTFDEAAELAYFGAQVLHPQSMRPAREGDIPVRVKNSYNPKAPGIPITRGRNTTQAVQPTSPDLKQIAAMFAIVGTLMLRQFGFPSKMFPIFEDLGMSVDPSKFWSRVLPWISIFGMYALQTTQAVQPTSPDLKQIAAMFAIAGTLMLRQFGFLAKVFSIFEDLGISVDPSKFWSRVLPWISIFVMYALQTTQAVQPTSPDSEQIAAMLAIAGTLMLRQFGFLAKVFSIFEDFGISVDPSKFWSRLLAWISIFGMYALQIVRKLAAQSVKPSENDGEERE